MTSNGTSSIAFGIRGESSKCEGGIKTSNFMSMVPSFLNEDKDVQEMVQMLRYEEEREMMLMNEVKIKMGEITNHLTKENRRSGC